MEKNYFKYLKPNVVVTLVGVLLVIAISAKDYWELSISVFGVVGTVIMLMSTYLWKYRPFIWLYRIDDFSGRYQGLLKSQYRDSSGKLHSKELKHVKIISQNGSRIIVSSFTIKDDGTKSSLSVSKGMYVEKTEDEQHYRLIYNYLNEGSTNQEFAPHYGTDIVKFIKNGNRKSLSGRYYTERTPFQTKGEFIELKWVNDDLNHEF